MIKLTIVTIVLSINISLATMAQDIHIIHCLKGCPAGTPATNDLIVREIYALSSNDLTKFADWAAYRVTSETIGTSKSLNRDWAADPLLSDDETLEPDDYKTAWKELHVDRGHQVPLASFAGTVFWRSTNFLSNITPQNSILNQGAWVDLESKVRDVAFKRKQVYVITGPLYDHANPVVKLPKADEEHRVPTSYFKVVSLPSGRMTAFIFNQATLAGANYCDNRVELTDVETASGLDLFPQASGWPSGDLNELLGCQ